MIRYCTIRGYRMTKELKATLSLCLGVILFGLGSTVLKILYRSYSQIHFTDVLTFRISLAAIAFLILTLIKNPSALKIKWPDLLYFVIFGTAGIFVVQYFLLSAVKNLNVGLATFIQSSATIMICAYSVLFLKERMSKYKLTGLVMGISGLVIIFWIPDLLRSSTISSVGLVAAVLSAFGKAFYILYGKKGASKYYRGAMMTYGLFSASLVSLLFSSPIKLIQDYQSEPKLWGLILILGIVCTFLPFVFYFYGLANIPASTAGILNIIEPVVGALTAFIILGERITLQQSIGCLLIVLGIIVLQFEYKKRKQDPAIERQN
jgi:DME family drug/metabolite transporter